MSMVNLYKDTMDPTLARTGNVIEPKVRNYVTQQLNIPFRVYDPKAVNYDVFSSHPIFGGIPDGEPLNQNQQVDYSTGMPMLEIKTSSIDSLLYKRERNELKMVKSSDGTPVIKEKNAKKKT
jgi:hypothetical protein